MYLLGDAVAKQSKTEELKLGITHVLEGFPRMLQAQSPGKQKQTNKTLGRQFERWGLRTLMVRVLRDDKVSLAPGGCRKVLCVFFDTRPSPETAFLIAGLQSPGLFGALLRVGQLRLDTWWSQQNLCYLSTSPLCPRSLSHPSINY